jgi:hypothetical protein
MPNAAYPIPLQALYNRPGVDDAASERSAA